MSVPKLSARGKKRRERVIGQWINLIDAVGHLEADVRRAQGAAFTPPEVQEFMFALDQLWMALSHTRPLLPVPACRMKRA